MPEQSSRQRGLLSSDRWGWLGQFVARWYADPLCAADSSPPTVMASMEQRLGHAVPTVLREWFDLVGARLRTIQDYPATPATLRDEDGAVAVWTENQGGWSILAGAGDDPLCRLDEPGSDFPAVPLSRALQAMLISDTLVGAWSEAHEGPLGRLADQVRGGVVHGIAPPVLTACRDAYPALPVPGAPFLGTPPRGDAATLLRMDESWSMGLEWATATEDAFRAFTALVDLDPPAGW